MSEPAKIDEPILNNVDATLNKDTPVTVAMLDQYMASMLADLEKNQNAQFQSLMLGMDKRLGEQIEPMIKRLNELTTFVNNVQQASQTRQEIAQPQGKMSIADMAEAGRPILELLREAGVIKGAAPSELDGPTSLVKRAIDRESRKILMKMISTSLKKGTLFADEVEEVIGEKLSEHPPV